MSIEDRDASDVTGANTPGAEPPMVEPPVVEPPVVGPPAVGPIPGLTPPPAAPAVPAPVVPAAAAAAPAPAPPAVPAVPAPAVPAPAFWQDRRTGKRVKKVGGDNEKEDIVLVKGADGVVYFATLSQLVPCDAAGTPDFDATFVRPDDPEEKIPAQVIEVVETRLNINAATAEEIARRIPGIGYRVAKKIVDLKMSMPGEVFRSLDQIKAASPRTNWDEVFRANMLFVG